MTVQQLRLILEENKGVFRLMPAWVPRSFCRPGKRIKLHPDDYYALGAARGGIDERWFSSTTHAENGPGTPDDEGLSYIALNEDASERNASVKTEFIPASLCTEEEDCTLFRRFASISSRLAAAARY